ncbi:MAG: hypothetical protein K2I06_05300 [Ruminococcus sp.]|nr:hypothetical protein [Ruminococcus sp.]
MKRLISFAVMVITAVMFFSCSTPLKSEISRKNGLNCAFQSSVNVTIDKLNADGVLKRFGDGVWDIEFESPNTLSGVKLEFSGGNVTASYKGLNFSVPQSALPVKAMMLNLIEAVDTNARLEELKGNENGDMLEVSGSLEGGDYIISVSRDGKLSSFEMENNKLKIVFTDMKEIEGTTEQEQTTTESATETVTEMTSETEESTKPVSFAEAMGIEGENTEETAEYSETDAEETVEIFDEEAEQTVEIPEEEAEQTVEIPEEEAEY